MGPCPGPIPSPGSSSLSNLAASSDRRNACHFQPLAGKHPSDVHPHARNGPEALSLREAHLRPTAVTKGKKNESQRAIRLRQPGVILEAEQPQELLAMRGELGPATHLTTS